MEPMWNTEVPMSTRTTGEARAADPIDQAYDAWKEADASAQALQRVVSQAWAQYDEGKGGPPPREQLLELASLRRAAADKLALAIELLHLAGHIQPSKPSKPGRVRRGVLRSAALAQQAAA